MDNISKRLLQSRLLFKLPHAVSATHQKIIIDEVVRNGTDLDVWYGYLVRGAKPYSDRQAYDNRLNPEFPWAYVSTPITDLIQELIAPLEAFYKPTRIKVFVQKPHESLIEHCDKLDYRYNLLFRDFLKTRQFHDFFAEPEHEKQGCLALKIPLTEVVGDNGKTYIRYEGSKYYIQPGHQYYVFNESRLRHGADPCPHHRGVIFVDGHINLKELEKLNLSAVPLVRDKNV